LAATALSEKGLIEYSRGNIKILHRGEPEKCSCECYEVVNRIVKPARRSEQHGRFG